MTTESVAERTSVPERLGKRVRAFVRKSSRRQRSALFAIAFVILGMLPGVLSELVETTEVLAGVGAAGLDVSHLDARALERALQKRASELEARTLGVRLSGRAFALEPRAVGFRVDVSKTAERALAAGREGGLFSRLAGVYARWFSPRDVELAYALDVAAVAMRFGSFAETAIADRAFGGGIRLQGTKVEALKPRAGRKLDAAGAERVLRRALVAAEPGLVELPVVAVPAPLPENAAEEPARRASKLVAGPITLVASEPAARVVLSPERIGTVLSTVARPPKLDLLFSPEAVAALLEETRKALELDAIDAKIEIDDKEKVSVVPSRTGLRIDLSRMAEVLVAAAERPDRTGELPLLHEPKPALSTEDAEHLSIKGLVSSFTTRHPCCEKRVANIHRIADIMNGRVVRPGETVSVNAIVGPRTLKAGFVPAPTIEEGEMVDSIGGGISQFATTFFNALFHGGYEIVERQPHSYWFPRYPMGHEATLSWPKPDIIFKNDTAAGMVFKTSYTGTSITVKIYGDNGGRKVRAQVSGRQNVIEPVVEILPNAHVPPDEEKVKEPGSVGWSVIVARVLTFPDGTTREDKRRVTYKPRPKRIEVHPCRIPKGEKGYTGERCPEPEDVEEIPEPP
jgi:vancomycin resistance protein YoaR